MNKKVIFIVVLTLMALIGITVFSFGSMSGKITSIKANPVSLKPEGTQHIPVNNQAVAFSSYHNKDMKENFYTVSFPSDWPLEPGQAGGAYAASSPAGSATVRLMDVPDNSTLELYVLSQEEPRLKKSLPDYKRLGYEKITVNGIETYQLTYQNTAMVTEETLAVYFAGADRAAVITLSAGQANFAAFLPLAKVIINSFNWENT